MVNAENRSLQVVIGHLLTGEKYFIITAEQYLKPEYCSHPFLSDIIETVFRLHNDGKTVDLVTVNEEFWAGDSKTLKNRLAHAREYFAIKKTAPDDDTRQKVPVFLSECTLNLDSGSSFESNIACVRRNYVQKERERLTKDYLDHIGRNPGDNASTQKYIQELQELQHLISKDAWKQSCLDLNNLRSQQTQGPLILRGESGLIYRGDVHQISGAPGTMKSKLSICIAAAALNDGFHADATLYMYAGASNLCVGYIDTELGEETIRRRLPMWEAACGRMVYNRERLKYLSLRNLSKKTRREQVYAFIEHGGCDIIIVDGLRDICDDFNDNKEASDLADTFKRLADSMGVAIIVTAHTSKGSDYSRGHLGSQFNDEVALAMLLKHDSGFPNIIDVSFTKGRHDIPESFAFTQHEGSCSLIVAKSLLDNTELSRSQRNALELFKQNLKPGIEYTHGQIMNLLKDTNKSTAKKYIKNAAGKTLFFNADKNTYKLLPDNPQDDLFLVTDDDLPA